MGPEKSANQDEEIGRLANSPLGSDDPTSKMWSLYISHVDEHDPPMLERWRSDMDGILIYTGVFSATVAAFLIENNKTLKPDSSVTASNTLRQIGKELAQISNGKHPTIPTTGPWSPPRYAVHVNILWFLSLCIGLFCGLGALLVQQWIRRYLRLTQCADTPLRRVRIRTFFYDGMQDFQVRWVVENISLLLHAAIFLFFAGLVEFLFAMNDEVAQFTLAVVCVFATIYIILTTLPIIFRQCPFQTPLTSGLWYISRILAITVLSLFSYSGRIRAKIDVLWGQVSKSIDRQLMDLVEHKSVLDRRTLSSALEMCRNDSDLEAFLDAVSGYLQVDQDIDSRIDDIASLLKPGYREPSLGHRIVHLFATCVYGHGRIDEVARRRRSITCARAIWEISKAILSVKCVALKLPRSLGNIIQRLSRDSDPTIAFSALSAIAVLECALLEQLADARAKKDLDRIKETAEVLAEAIGENDPLSPRYLAGLRNDDRSDGRLTAVTQFMSSMLTLIPLLEHPSRGDLEDIKLTLRELCREMNGRKFSPAAQQRFVDVLSRTWNAHEAAESRVSGHHSNQACPCVSKRDSGIYMSDQSPTETYHSTIISATQGLVLTLGLEAPKAR